MKKILLILGILAGILPAVADDSVPTESVTGLNVKDLIHAKSNIEDGCSGEAFQVDTSETPLQMAAVYVDGCPTEKDDQNNDIGKYLYVADEASIGNDGTLSGVSCELCPAGHECPGISFKDIKINDNGVLSSQGSKECSKGMYSDETGLIKCKYCAAGTYQDTEGQTSCTPAAAGYYVEKGGSDVQIQCPVGYRAGTTTGGTSIYSCQKQITQAMCNAEKNNFNTGTMTIKSGLNFPLLVNYRDLDNHCFGSLSCNYGYHKQNVWGWVAENPGAGLSVATCPISGKLPQGTYDNNTNQWITEYVPCNNGQEPGTMSFTLANNAPMKKFNMVMTCSAQTITLDENQDPVITLGYGDAGYDNLSRTPNKCYDANGDVIANKTTQAECEEVNGATWQLPTAGGNCWMRNVDAPDQPWIYTGSYGSVEKCEAECMSGMNRPYPFVITSNNNPIVHGSDGKYYAQVNNQFILQAVVEPNSCYDYNDGAITLYPDLTTNTACWAGSHIWNESGEYYENAVGATPTSDIGTYTYLVDDGMLDMMAAMQAKTENDPRYSGANAIYADNNPVNICAANPVNITWGDVTLEQNDPARTCTYGGDLITPTSEPASDGSRLFLGWKPVTSTPAP